MNRRLVALRGLCSRIGCRALQPIPTGVGRSGHGQSVGRPVSESGRLCHGDVKHEWGDRPRRAFLLSILVQDGEIQS